MIWVEVKHIKTYFDVKELLWKNCTDIIITKADKGGTVVIMYVKDYINAAHRQLNNKYHYKNLNKDPTKTKSKLVKYIIQRFKKEKLFKKQM